MSYNPDATPDSAIVLQAQLKALESFLDGHVHELRTLYPSLGHSATVDRVGATSPTGGSENLLNGGALLVFLAATLS